MDVSIKLNPHSILTVPIEKYNKDFTFIVNDQMFQTSRLIADLLSPKICHLHYEDPTINEFIIQTQESGSFSYILSLLSFEQISIPEAEIPFIEEVLQILNNKSIEATKKNMDVEITMSNIFKLIQKHEKFEKFYAKQLQEEIDFLSSCFYLIEESQMKEFTKLKFNVIEQIINNPKIQLKSEDQLISVINELYKTNCSYSLLYECVNFSNVTVEKINEFLNVYDINNLTQELWKLLSLRLEQRIVKNKYDDENNKSRYHKKSNLSVDEPEKQIISIPYQENNQFDGIINYLANKSPQGNIFNEIKITSSSTFWDNSPRNAVLFNDHSKYFFSQNQENSWICFNFLNHKVIPKNYSVRSHDISSNNCHPKSWVIEGSNDGDAWEEIDSQNDCDILNGSLIAFTFSINNDDDRDFQYLRMRQTDSCWNGSYNFSIDSIEFFGILK